MHNLKNVQPLGGGKGVRKGDGVGAGGRANIENLKRIGAMSMAEARRRCPGLVRGVWGERGDVSPPGSFRNEWNHIIWFPFQR